jgi:hypothetical protein
MGVAGWRRPRGRPAGVANGELLLTTNYGLTNLHFNNPATDHQIRYGMIIKHSPPVQLVAATRPALRSSTHPLHTIPCDPKVNPPPPSKTQWPISQPGALP